MKQMAYIMIIALLALTLAGCVGISVGRYDNADKYTAGDTVVYESISAVDIEWVSGSVNIVRGYEKGVSVREKTNSDIGDDWRLHWWLDGSVLRVRFAKSGVKIKDSKLKKELTVTLPADMVLESLSVSASSADVNTNGTAAENIRVDVASGDVELKNENGKITVNSASGSVKIVGGKINELRVDTASGAVTYAPDAAPANAWINTASGNVTVTLPGHAGFTLKADTASGRISSDYEMRREGNNYVYGDGAGALNIETASGNINIKAK